MNLKVLDFNALLNKRKFQLRGATFINRIMQR